MTAAPGTAPGEVWDAPQPSGPLDATVSVPGSKSLTNRFLVLAAIADAPVTVRWNVIPLAIGAVLVLAVAVDLLVALT